MDRRTLCRRGGLAVVVTAFATDAALAQYPMPAMIPPNPLYQHPAYRFQFYLGATVPTMSGRTFVGITVPYTRAPQLFSPYYGQPLAAYPWQGPRPVMAGGYVSGGTSSTYAAMMQRTFEAAQRAAQQAWSDPEAARRLIAGQFAYERAEAVSPAAPAPRPLAADIVQALSPPHEQLITSGEALNTLLHALRSVDLRSVEGAAVYLPPQLLRELRFAGPKGELINLLRRIGTMPVPEVFHHEAARNAKDAFERDFAAIALAILGGKAPERTAVARMEASLQRLEAVAAEQIRQLPFDDAIAARRFLNQMAQVVALLKSANVAQLWNGNWDALGLSAAELVRHMIKHDLRFAAATPEGEAAYVALHRALVMLYVASHTPKK